MKQSQLSIEMPFIVMYALLIIMPHASKPMTTKPPSCHVRTSLLNLLSQYFHQCIEGQQTEIKEESIDTLIADARKEFIPFLRNIKEAKENYRRENISDEGEYCHNIFERQIINDLRPFSKGISKEMIDIARPSGTMYQIIGNKLYREIDCKFPTRCTGVEHFLRKIIGILPDMEFVINVSDWPHIPIMWKHIVPVFSFSKTQDYLDIMYPAWSFWDGGPVISKYPMGIGRWDKMRKTLIRTARNSTWDKKISQGFFRGSRTSSERDPLILLSRKDTSLVDAKYTKNQAWKSPADTLNEDPASEVSFEEHCKYKYLFNFRGVAASFRFRHLFLCNSLVFHVGNEWLEFFYFKLKPWIHYIPVAKNINEQKLKTFLEFAKVYDNLSRRIAREGYNFVKSHLKLRHVTCYWKHLLLKYHRLLDYKITRRESMIQIK